jgi:myo-inositol-1(or 4)-monophosphatase
MSHSAEIRQPNSALSPLTDEELTARLLAAQAVGAEAGKLARRFLENPETLNVVLKGPQDFLTAADLAVERLIIDRLSTLFPDDTFLAEESSATRASAGVGRLWVVDPIDGTANFASGRPDWCISIGFVSAGQPTIGVIDVPMTGAQYAARRGKGASRNGEPIHTSSRASLSDATVAIDSSFRTPPEPYLGILAALLARKVEHRRNGSAAISLAQVADGKLDGFAELHLYPWDVAAGIVLVAEAGGWVNDFFAGDGWPRGGPVVAAASGIRDEFRGVVEPFLR